MTSLKAILRKFDAVVMPVRFVREARKTWHVVKSSSEQEQRRRAMLRERGGHIDAYLACHDKARRLQIGAGDNPLRGWLNTDLEPVSDAVTFMDALDWFPFRDSTFDHVFSEHMIEHVPYKGGLFMLKEAFRVLKAGGTIRIATPDVDRVTGLLAGNKNDEQRRYIQWSSSESLGLYSDQPSKLQQRRPEWAIDAAHIRRFFPDETRDCACFIVNNFFRSYGHQFLYDAKTLAAALMEAGFADVRKVLPGQSQDANLNGIDSHGRRIGEENNLFETMVLEAMKPADLMPRGEGMHSWAGELAAFSSQMEAGEAGGQSSGPFAAAGSPLRQV